VLRNPSGDGCEEPTFAARTPLVRSEAMKHFALLFVVALAACDGVVPPVADAAIDRTSPGDARSDASVAMDAQPDATMDAAADVADASLPADSGVAIDARDRCGSGPPECEPGPGTGNADQCFDAPSCFLRAVQSSIRAVIAANPTYFDMSAGTPRVTNEAGYMNGVVDELRRRGLCAIIDPNAGDEIVVKHDNDLAENFDILTADSVARSGDGIFTATCAPAWF
jgi:hypothetical protein